MIPGRILVVDNRKGDVDELVAEFLKRGEHAMFSELPVNSEYYRNVRLLILDYYLLEESEENSLGAICEIVRGVAENSKFFMLIVWSARVTKSNRREFKESIMRTYEERYRSKLPCILLDPIGKGELDHARLIEKIDQKVADYPEIGLLYEIEKMLDKTKDKVVTRIYEIGNWSNLVRSLKEEYNTDSVGRQMLAIYVNLLKRELTPTPELRSCVNRVARIVKASSDVAFGKVYSAQYYYQVSEKEQVGVGDVLREVGSSKYYIVITPECDITNNKHTATTLVESRRIEHSELADSDYIKKIAGFYRLREKNGTVRSSRVIEAVVKGTGLKGNYFVLPFLEEGEAFYHLVFDFHKMKTLKKAKRLSELKGYRRMCRVDSPMINRFIQQYVSQCSRVGTMTIPDELLETLVSRIPNPLKKE
jgi:hypothetical protein